MAISGVFADRGAFKVPSLRNVGSRTRFMQNGQFTSLDQVVAFYGRGGDFSDGQYDAIGNISLTTAEQQSLTAFISFAFDDPRVATETGVFSRPTLQSEVHASPGTAYGQSRAGSGGYTPEWIAVATPQRGNSAFKVGLGGATAYLGVVPSAAQPGATAGGVPLNINLFDPSLTAVTLTLSGSGHGNGHATFHAPIPDDPALVGLTLYGQWWVEDPGAVNGFATSKGLQLTIF